VLGVVMGGPPVFLYAAANNQVGRFGAIMRTG
jgi:hypothetical protein